MSKRFVLLMSGALLPLLALAFVDGRSTARSHGAPGKCKVVGLPLYSAKCERVIKASLEPVDGLADLTLDRKKRTASFTLRDKKATKAFFEAKKKGGYGGNYLFDEDVFVAALTFDIWGVGTEGNGPFSEINFTQMHACCDACRNEIIKHCQGAKVEFSGDGAVKDVKIAGKELNYKKILKDTQDAGFRFQLGERK